MMKTYLIDLDDTLLGNDMDTFIPPYLKLIADTLKEYASTNEVIQTMMEATQLMMTQDQPNITLKNCFDEYFYPKLGINFNAVQPILQDFYATRYLQLGELTQKRLEAIKLIDTLVSRGDRIVIATNPLFPDFAVQPRLDWAGLPKENYKFEMITTYDDYHFSKPHPAYYAEVLAQIGWPEGPVIMIGNDNENDIEPAQKLGLATFYINPDEERNHQYVLDGEPSDASGWLDKVTPWVDSVPEEHLTPSFHTPEAFIAILKSTPAAAQTLIRPLAKELLGQRTSKDSWSLGEIFCHLRDVDLEINLPRINTLLTEQDAFITAVNADVWIEERQYQEQDPLEAFEEFMQARIKLLTQLNSLSDTDWMRSARHTIFGPTNLKELIRITSRHDRLHMQQIYKTYQSLI